MGTIIKIKNVSIQIPNTKSEGRSVPAVLAETAGVPQIGEPWPEQGGIRAGYMPPEDGQPGYSIIVADGAGEAEEELPWGNTGKEIAGLSARDGKANTEKLAGLTGHPAADFCAGLMLHGFTDWYLPSRREASIMAGAVPRLFSPGWHWTSSQSSAYYAFVQRFGDGGQGNGSEDYGTRLRAVRRVIH